LEIGRFLKDCRAAPGSLYGCEPGRAKIGALWVSSEANFEMAYYASGISCVDGNILNKTGYTRSNEMIGHALQVPDT
jgi:hypothetical protein